MNEADDNDLASEPAAEDRKRPKRKKPVLSKNLYDVGYGRPPAEHQFKPGQSGNPSGRPKGARNKPSTRFERFKATFKEEIARTITVNNGDRPTRMSFEKVIIRTLMNKAAKGNVRAGTWLAGMNMQIEREEKQRHEQQAQQVSEYVWHWDNELALRRQLGIHGAPEPLPHPCDIQMDRQGNWKITGPVTPAEVERDRHLEAERQKGMERLAQIERDIKAEMKKFKDRRFNADRVRANLYVLLEEGDNLKTWIENTDRKNRYG